MRLSTHNKAGTKERLLTAACARFAAQGYVGTTVQQVCADAEANIAAVNYHFGSKLKLYRAAWQRAVAELNAAYPIPDQVGDQALAWLKTYMNQRLRAVFDKGPAGWLPDLIRRELMAPSPLHEEIVRDRMQRNQKRIQQAVAAYLGEKANEHDVHHCSAMVTGSFVMFNMGKTLRERFGRPRHQLRPEPLENAIERTLTYHVGGLQAVRRRLGKAREGAGGDAHA